MSGMIKRQPFYVNSKWLSFTLWNRDRIETEFIVLSE